MIKVGDKYKLKDHWICLCGQEHSLSGAYLAAHWDIELIYTCDNCKRIYTFRSGKVLSIITPKK